MSSVATLTAVGAGPASPARWRTLPGVVEYWLLALVLAAIVLLPLIEAVLRKTLNAGIAGSATLVQHLTLLASMLGAAAAARDDKLLALFNLTSLLGARAQAIGRFASHAFAAAVCGLLCGASAQLVAAERAAGNVIAYGIPVWAAQSVLPAGFLLIALRLAWRAGASAPVRAAAACLVVGLLASAPLWAAHADLWFFPALLLLVTCALMGAPVFAILAGIALFLFAQQSAPLASIPLDHYRLVVNPALPAIPLFTLAGFILAAGGAPARLTRLFQALFGHFRGGVAIAAVTAGAFFTAFTGASGVTILALGGLLLPLLVAARYRERDALGLVTGAGSLGALLPPCLPIVLYAIVAKVSMQKMFLGALLPGILLIVLAAWWGARRDPRSARDVEPFDWNRARRAVRAAKWELALPVVALASLFGGFATPVEAAALTALYTFVVGTCIHRDLRDRRRWIAVATECGTLVGGVLLILGVALGLTNYLVDIQLTERAVGWATQTIQSKWLFLLALNVLLLAVGCLMDIFSAIVVIAPLVVPIGLAFGVDPVHLGVIILANLELGYLTPPVGVNLFYASSRFNKPISEVCRSVAPLLPILAIGVLLITYLPWLSTALPAAFR
ncbi:MAG: TRAP transporter large permease subunit [Burkholderiales bacterium]